MSNLNPNIPSPELSRLMTTAIGRMKEYGLTMLTPQLLLRVFLDEESSSAHQILKQLSNERGFDWEALTRRVDTMAKHSKGRDAKFWFTDDFGNKVLLAEEMLITIDEGLTIAQSRDELNVTSGHALAAMADQRVTTFAVLQRVGVTHSAVTNLLTSMTHDGTQMIRDFIDEAKNGTIEPVFERKALMQQMLSLLALKRNRNIFLVGPRGCGKRTLGQSLALVLTENPTDGVSSLVQINESIFLEKPETQLEAVQAAIRRARAGILLVPEIGRFFPTRGHQKFPTAIGREMQKAVHSEDIVVVGTLEIVEFDRISGEDLVREKVNRLDVPPATVDETVAILNYHRNRLETEYKIDVEREALEKAAQLAGQYIKTTALPGAAVQLADRACALVKMAGEGHVEMDEVSADSKLSPDDVMVATSIITKVPVTKLGEDESSRYANMVEHLHKRIIGQDEAVMAVSRAVKIARVGLRNPKRPIGSFLFLGPSGVGKTELAKALAEFMFGNEDAMIVLDMSEYQDESSVNRLIGAPPGYVGFEGGGQLTDFVREKPYTVVLFDEVEKAHPRVLDVLLQVLEEGRLTDGKGRLTTFSETVVIMTSNIGSKHMLVPVIGERERAIVMDLLLEFLRPEFVNRIDDVILFHQLTNDQLAKILELMLRKEFKLATKQGLNLQISAEAKTWMLAQNDQPEYGARPLRRIIAKSLREPLADFLLENMASAANATILVDEGEDGLSFETQKAV